MKILTQKEMSLLSRKRITAVVEHPNKPTPKKDDLAKELATSQNCKVEVVDIVHIYTKFGDSSSKIIANIYNDEETAKQFLKKDAKKKSSKKN
jgi:ribosomal protein S24E